MLSRSEFASSMHLTIIPSVRWSAASHCNRWSSHLPRGSLRHFAWERAQKPLVPINDETRVKSGKWKGYTFREVYDNDKPYCEWAASKVELGAHSGLLQLASYSMKRELQDRNNPQASGSKSTAFPAEVCSSPDCLRDVSFVITGNDPRCPRDSIQHVIQSFGGKVKYTVTSKVDFLLVAGSFLKAPFQKKGVRRVEESTKYEEAVKLGIPRINGMEALLDFLDSASMESGDSSACVTLVPPTTPQPDPE